MPDKRLCYLTSQRVTAYRWKSGVLRKEAVFGMNKSGIAEFSKYAAGAPQSLFYLLADVVEEDFFQENIPSVRGADRRSVLSRKIAQRYRDVSLAVPISLGTETHAGRREERILFTSFTNSQQIQPWLESLRSNNARVAGVFSVALVAASAGKRLGFKQGQYLIVSLQEAGLRQSYVENGRIRFSRLSRVNLADPRSLAQDCATESNRIHQYLVNTRIVPREASPLDVLVLAPSEHKALYEAVCVDSPRLRFHVRDLDKVARSLGLKSAPAETQAEGLFLHVLAQEAPREQFADDDLRRLYDLWRASVGLVLGGSAVLGACLLYSGVNLIDLRHVNEQTIQNQRQQASLSAQYASLQSNFPKTPTSADNLKVIVKNYRTLLGQTSSPLEMFVQISEAVTALPQVEIDKIDWEAGAAKSGQDAPKAQSSSSPQATSAQAESSQVSGKLSTARASDYRAVTALVNEFAGLLRRQPGIEVNRTLLPFDINAERSISGDIGAARREEIPRFTVTLSKRREK